MITILIFAFLFHIIISLLFDGFISKPSFVDTMFSILLGFFITVILSVILFACNVGEYETVNINNYEKLIVGDDKCCVTIYEFYDDGSYSIEKDEIDLSNCTFIEDGTQVIKHQRWNYAKGINWTFLLPIFDTYIIYK